MRCSGITLAFLLCLPALAHAEPLFGAAQDPLAGSRVFGTKGCVKCHAVNGIGAKVGPDLGRTTRPRSFYDLATELWNHAPRMAQRMEKLGIARPQLDAVEMGDLVAFLYTLDYFDPRGNPDAGKRIFSQKRCVFCHQVGGTGGVVGPSLDLLKQYGSPIYLATAMWNHGSKMAEVMKSKGVPRPVLTGADLRNLIAYIDSASPLLAQGPLYVLPGNAAEGRVLFTQKRCVECHAAGGQGGRVGPDLAERGVHRSLGEFTAAMWNTAPRMIEEMRNRSVPTPEVKPEEMADIVAYLYSVGYFAQSGDPGRGLAVARAKGCLGCHGVRGQQGTTAVDLTQVKGLDSPAAVLSALWNHVWTREPRPAKAPWPELRPAEMADLMAFLQSVGGAR